MTISNLACVQFKIDEDIIVYQQQALEDSSHSNSSNDNSLDFYDEVASQVSSKASTAIQLIKNSQLLNYCFVENFLENKGLMSNYNLILLFKDIRLNSHLRRGIQDDPESLYQYNCLTINDILCTWSLQIHIILFESLVKPALDFRSKLPTQSVVDSSMSTNDLVKFKLNVLVESDILINFLFDYSQDSSKVDVAKESKQTIFGLDCCWLIVLFRI